MASPFSFNASATYSNYAVASTATAPDCTETSVVWSGRTSIRYCVPRTAVTTLELRTVQAPSGDGAT